MLHALALVAVLSAPAQYAADVDTLLARVRAHQDAEALELARSLTQRSGDDAFLWRLRGDLASGTESVDAYRHAFALGSGTRADMAEALAGAFARNGQKDSS